MTDIFADVIIVGSGVAGALLAAKLAEAGIRVAVLEAGPKVDRAEAVQRYWDALIKVPESPYPPTPEADHPITHDRGYWYRQSGPDEFKSTYLKVVGGTTWHWLGTCVRYVPSDFRLKTAYGRGIDWPIGYDDLEAFYAEAEREIHQATQSFYTARSTGTRGSKALFSTVTANTVTQAQVDASSLKPVDPSDFMIIPVALSSSSKLEIKIPAKSKTLKNPEGIKHVEIQPFVEETGRAYVTGNAYYRLTKSEKYHYGKGIALVHRTTRKVYRGPECEKLIGLDQATTRIKPPAATDEYEVYVRSTSFNRQIEVGGSVLLFNK